MPGLMVGKLKDIAQGIADAWQTLYKSGADSRINKDDVVETAEYIRSMGYDLVGYGFIPANDLTSSEDYETVDVEKDINEKGELLDDDGNVEGGGAGKYYDKYGIGYTSTGDEKGATNSFETAGKITDYLEDETDVSIIKTYAMTNLRMFTVRNYDSTIEFFDFLHDLFVNNDNDWATGLISLWVAKDFEATEEYSMTEMGHVTVDPSTKTMHIQKGWFNNELVFDMDGWTGRYGMSLEFLLSLHLATMAPELVSTMARTFDTEVQVYLDEFEKATVAAYYSNNKIDYYPESDFPWWIGNKEARDVMYQMDIKSKKQGKYTCKYSEDPPVITFNGEASSGKHYSDVADGHSGFIEVIKMEIIVSWIVDGAEVLLDAAELLLDGHPILAGEKVVEFIWNYSIVGELKTIIETAWESFENNKSLQDFKDALQDEHVNQDILNAINDSSDWNDYLSKEENGLDEANFNTLISKMNSTISYLKTAYPDYQFDDKEPDENGIDREVSKSISEFSKTYTKDDLEDIIPFSVIKSLPSNGDPYQGEICTFHSSEPDVGDQKTIRVLLVACKTEVDGNYDFAVASYQERSPNEIGTAEEVCSDHLEDIDKVCTSCEKYVESIRNSLQQISDNNFKSYIPYIARVIGSWYRDTYFVVPEDKDAAIEKAYDERSDYGGESGAFKLTADNLQYINIDEEYLKKTDEHWTKYEVKKDASGMPELDANGNVQYVLYELYNDGTVSNTPYAGTKEQADEDGIQLVKKADTSKISSEWVAYTNSKSSTPSDYTLYEVDASSPTTIKNATYYNEDGAGAYDEILYYTMAGVPSIEQTEDGRRGITNAKIKKMFKIRQYYIYDGTSEKAEKIYLDWQKVLHDYGDECLDKYDIEDSDFDKKYGDSDDSIKIERAVEWALDDFYYENDHSIFGTNDPRNKDLIGNITINKDTLNAFSILENTHTLDADYQYRDFKELIVELDYFDKEDLSDKPKKVFNWIIPGYEPSWPVRMIDKSEEYYGTQIHYDETVQNLKTYYGISSPDPADPDAAAVPAETDDMDMQQLSTATGYTEGLDVISPVTGKVISYGTYERKNTDSEKYDNDSEVKDEVGFIQIKVLDKPDIFTTSNAPGQTNGIQNHEILNAFYEEYEDVCDGYIVTIDGIELLNGINSLDDLIASASSLQTATLEPNAVPNLADNDQEEERKKMEKAKVEIPIAGLTIYNTEDGKDEIYIREGTIIGKTIKTSTTTDYSYMRVILRNEELAVQENVEKYFDLPVSMMYTAVANASVIALSSSLGGGSLVGQDTYEKAMQYWDTVQKYSSEYGVDPYLVIAMMCQESSASPTSDNGNAYGLLQWEYASNGTSLTVTKADGTEETITGITKARLTGDTDFQIKVGCAELKSKLDAFNGNTAVGLQGYNFGEAGVKRCVAYYVAGQKNCRDTSKRYCGVTEDDVMLYIASGDTGWLEARQWYKEDGHNFFGVGGGDPQYLEHVLRYYNNGGTQ